MTVPVGIILNTLQSPVGDVFMGILNDELVALDFSDCMDRTAAFLDSRFDAWAWREEQGDNDFSRAVMAYFNGDVNALNSLRVNTGGTPFQQAVWKLLRDIPWGHTRSYGDLAADLGKPTASRAVGAANGRNPIALVLPCHRVIGANGALTGYAGGVERKRWLLQHEGALLL